MPTNLQYLREAKGYSQSDLAKEAKVSQSTISIIESEGRRARPRVMKAIADVLGVGVHDIEEFQPLPKPEAA